MRMLLLSEYNNDCPIAREYYSARGNRAFHKSSDPDDYITLDTSIQGCANEDTFNIFCTFDNSLGGSKFPAIQARVPITETGPVHNGNYSLSRSGTQTGISAVPGFYVVDYTVKDKAGNSLTQKGDVDGNLVDRTNPIYVSRTVVVKDSLPPVIRLTLNSEVIGKGTSSFDSSMKGHNAQPNPFTFM